MNSQIRRQLKWLVMGTALMGMGVAMPNCPGQQAMQQQIDSLQTSQAEITKRMMNLDTQVKAVNGKLQAFEDFAKQASESIQAQKTAIEALGAAVKELQARPIYTPPPAPAKKTAATGRKKAH